MSLLAFHIVLLFSSIIMSSFCLYQYFKLSDIQYTNFFFGNKSKINRNRIIVYISIPLLLYSIYLELYIPNYFYYYIGLLVIIIVVIFVNKKILNLIERFFLYTFLSFIFLQFFLLYIGIPIELLGIIFGIGSIMFLESESY